MMAIFALVVSVLSVSTVALALDSTPAFFQARPEGGKILVNVSSGAGGPAAELVDLMDKAQVQKTVDQRGNPTYSADPMWAFSMKDPDGSVGYAFFSRIALADESWSLTNLIATDATVNPPVSIQGMELFLDGATSKTLYEIMGKAGVVASTGGPVTTYRTHWISCDQRNFDPQNPFWVCVIRNYNL